MRFTVTLKVGSDPTMPAFQIAAAGQIKIQTPERKVLQQVRIGLILVHTILIGCDADSLFFL
jgi:hypothetical protein